MPPFLFFTLLFLQILQRDRVYCLFFFKHLVKGFVVRCKLLRVVHSILGLSVCVFFFFLHRKSPRNPNFIEIHERISCLFCFPPAAFLVHVQVLYPCCCFLFGLFQRVVIFSFFGTHIYTSSFYMLILTVPAIPRMKTSS
ncbi:hypothetical protein MEZE111188_02310 [Mesobacillus zeae]